MALTKGSIGKVTSSTYSDNPSNGDLSPSFSGNIAGGGALPGVPTDKSRTIVHVRQAFEAVGLGTGRGLGPIDDSVRGKRKVQASPAGNILWEGSDWWGKKGGILRVPRLVILQGLYPGATWSIAEDGSDGLTADRMLAIDQIDTIYPSFAANDFTVMTMPSAYAFFISPSPNLVLSELTLTHGLPLSGIEVTDASPPVGNMTMVVDPATFVGGDLLVISFVNSYFDVGYVQVSTIQHADPVTNLFGDLNLPPYFTAITGPPYSPLGTNQRRVIVYYSDSLAADKTTVQACVGNFRKYRHVYAVDTYGGAFGCAYSPQNDGTDPIAGTDYAAMITGVTNTTSRTFNSRDLSTLVSLVSSEVANF